MVFLCGSSFNILVQEDVDGASACLRYVVLPFVQLCIDTELGWFALGVIS